MTHKEQLIYLLEEFHKGNYRIKDFCSHFERIFNLELNKHTLNEKELAIFETVFNVISHFNDRAEERANWSGFKNEEDVKIAVQSARVSLNLD